MEQLDKWQEILDQEREADRLHLEYLMAQILLNKLRYEFTYEQT